MTDPGELAKIADDRLGTDFAGWLRDAEERLGQATTPAPSSPATHALRAQDVTALIPKRIG